MNWNTPIGKPLLIALAVFALWRCSRTDDPPTKPSGPTYDAQGIPIGLRHACREFIVRGLHDPKRAEFDGYTEWPAVKLGPDRYRVDATFRAPNAFGGLVLAKVRCDTSFDGRTYLPLSIVTLR